ncbi:peptidyl-prolyl cis-trans isomerase [bacterium]|nr:peptidyl-prolyl cis-trans isomerase [bacterium]
MTRKQTIRRLSRAAATAAAVLAFAAAIAPSAFAQDSRPAAVSSAKVEAIDTATLNLADEDPIFEAFGKTYTAGEWNAMVHDYPPAILRSQGMMSFDINNATKPRVLMAIKSWATEQAAARKGRELGLKPSPGEQQHLDREKQRFARNMWVEKMGLSDLPEPTEEQMRTYYDEHKSDYSRPEQLQMRHIFIPTYRFYTVEDGDTLESIAEKIAGDASLADKILDDATKKPRADKVIDVNGEEMPAQALQTGELLLVPVAGKKAEEAKQRIDEAYQKLKDGEDFLDVAKEYSDSKEPGRLIVVDPNSEQEILPLISETFEALGDGEFSEPIRTKHGWQIVYREQHLEKGYQPYNEVDQAAKRAVRREMQIAKFGEIFSRLFLQFRDRIDINEEALANIFDDKYAGDILVKTEDFEYPVSDFLADYGTHIDENTPIEERVEMLSTLPRMRQQLFKWSMDHEGIMDSDELKVKIDSLADIFYSNAYYRSEIQEQVEAPSEEVLRAEYDKNIEKYRQPATVEVWQFYVAPPIPDGADEAKRAEILDAEKDRVTKKLADVTSPEAFSNKARTIGEGPDAQKGGEMGAVGVHFLDGFGETLIEDAEENSIYGPVVIGDRVYAFWIGEKTAESVKPFEDAKQEIGIRLSRVAEQEARDSVSQDLLEDADVVILVDDLKELDQNSKSEE